MRLIDADDLIITILTHDLCDTEQIDKDILEAPTVEAIPIEWIEERIRKYIFFYEEKKKREPEVARLFAQGIDELSELLDDWRAENEPY